MDDSETESALIDIVHHEHDHLRRLFDDIAGSFEKIVAGKTDVESEADKLESAADELGLALEEMLHHFNQEEEVLFVELEERFPELSDDVRGLVHSHETMCDKTRSLKQRIGGPLDEIADRAEDILEVLREMNELLDQHTEEENRLFGLALEKMPEEDRQRMLEEMRRI